MEQTFADLYTKLKDTREYAQVRISALSLLKKIVIAEGYRHNNFMPNLYKAQDVICNQVNYLEIILIFLVQGTKSFGAKRVL